MIGKLWIDTGRHAVAAVMLDDGTWHCDDANFATLLNTLFPPPLAEPASGHGTAPELIHHLYRAGERLGARVVVCRDDAVCQGGAAAI